MTRTDFVTALNTILNILSSGEPYTLRKLSQEANLNYKTVRKILNVLESSQDILSGKQLDVSSMDNFTTVRIREKTGLALFPENIQNLIIKTQYYPTVSREEEVLVHLFLKNAVDEKSAISIPDGKILDELANAELVKKYGDKYHLTEEGRYVAKGALKLYPELKDSNAEKQTDVYRRVRSFVQWGPPLPPNIPMMRQKSKRSQKK